jgi:murein DD-endopeptidase MepM/ murein hydrolase activator NlpD
LPLLKRITPKGLFLPAIGLTLAVVALLARFLSGSPAPPPVAVSKPAALSATVRAEASSPPQKKLYGIGLGGLEAVRRSVQPGQNLSEILQDHGVGYAKILAVAKSCEGIFDLRSLRPGRPFCVLRQTGPEAGARYFIYEKNDIDYLVFDLADPVSVTVASKPVEIRERIISGEIAASLWNTLRRQQVDPEMVLRLAEIYAWTIDFHHLQSGDRFNVVFEEKFVDGKYAGLGRISGVRFRHRHQDHYAFFYQNGTHGEYFDESGQSLRKALLKAPLHYTRISSGYSRRRLHPITGKYRPHPGIDYAAPTGTPVLSVGDGEVVRAATQKNNGNYIAIRHNSVYQTQYLHLSRFAKGIHPGKAVRQGEVIGYVGSTGRATGPHLDFRLWVNGRAVNPQTYDIPAAMPVQTAQLADYREQMAGIKGRLDRLHAETREAGRDKA